MFPQHQSRLLPFELTPTHTPTTSGKACGEHEDSVDDDTATFTLVFLILLVTSLIMEQMIRRYKITWIPGAGATMLLGIVAALFMLLKEDDVTETLMSFSAEVFMVAFLPPIIFNEGYMMKSRFFFANFNRIITFAFLVSCATILPLSLPS
jgi:NhaP-type Na+/H+ or K+/H+ antiporter